METKANTRFKVKKLINSLTSDLNSLYFRVGLIFFFLFIIVYIYSAITDLPSLGFLSLSILSVIYFSMSLILFVCNFIRHSGSSIKSNLVYPTIFLFLSIWSIRFNVGIHTDIFSIDNAPGLNAWEHFWNALVHALQSFSMDEDYTEYIASGKAFILAQAYPQSVLRCLAVIYGGYSAVLNALAPIAGGAILFDILTNIFPELRLRLQLTLHPHTRSYVFSELNERSIALAESIHSDKPGSFIVFTDVYVAEDEEKPSEQLARAKKINALCLKADLSILKKLSWGPVNYYLIDDSEAANIASFAALSEYSESNSQGSFIDLWTRKSSDIQIYIFSDSEIIDQMIENFNTLCEQKNLKLVFAKPVNIPELMSYQLIHEFPLYRSIAEAPDKANKTHVSILLLGEDQLVKHFLKTAYWCGQMLNPYAPEFPNTSHPVRIYPEFHIICPDTMRLQKGIAAEMPQIYSELKSDKISFTYAVFHFHEADMRSSDISDIIQDIPEIDYCLISLEDDLQNIGQCQKIKELLDRRYLSARCNTDILCVVENAELNRVNTQLAKTQSEIDHHIRLHYIGSINEQYKISTVEKTLLEEEATLVDYTHATIQEKKLYANLYNYRSSIASALHYQYKLFSSGVFIGEKGEPAFLSYSYNETCFTKHFLHLLLGLNLETELTNTAPKADKKSKPASPPFNTKQQNLMDLLLWQEKIRWNCFIKTEGFSTPSCQEVFEVHKVTKAFKLHNDIRYPSDDTRLFSNHNLMLHACLVDLYQPNGIVLKDIKTNINYRSIREEVCSALSTNRWNITAWPDFLNYLLAYYANILEDPLDTLDMFSILASEEYKNYDMEQIPILAIHRLLRNTPQKNKADLFDKISCHLQTLAAQKGYLWQQFEEIHQDMIKNRSQLIGLPINK